jgi:hypothetical protein
MSLLNATSRTPDPAQPAPSPAPGGTGLLIDKAADQAAVDLARLVGAAPGNDDPDGACPPSRFQGGASLPSRDPDGAGSPGRDPDGAGPSGRDPDGAGSPGRDPDGAGPSGHDPDGFSSIDPGSMRAGSAAPDRTGPDSAVLVGLDLGTSGTGGDGPVSPGLYRLGQEGIDGRMSDFGRVDLRWANPGGAKVSVVPSFTADSDGYPLTGRLSGVPPGMQPDDPSSPEEAAEPCVIAVVTVEPTSRERDAVRLPLVIAAVLAAPGRA